MTFKTQTNFINFRNTTGGKWDLNALHSMSEIFQNILNPHIKHLKSKYKIKLMIQTEKKPGAT